MKRFLRRNQNEVNRYESISSGSTKKKTLTLIGICIAMVGQIMASSGLSTLLPAAALEIGGTEYYSLGSNIAGILGVSIMPLYGYWGAKNPANKTKLFSISLVIGAVVTLLRGLASSMVGFIIPSIFWGVVTAAIFVIGFSIIRDMYDTKKAGTYLGVMGTMLSIGMLAGPAMTGLIIDGFSWRIVCHIIWPILLVSAIFVFLGVRVTREETKEMAHSGGSFDYAGTAALIVFLATLILSLSFGSSFIPFGSLLSNLLLVVAAIAFVALILIIRKKQERAIIPAPVLKDRNTVCLSMCNLLLNFSGMAIFFFMPT